MYFKLEAEYRRCGSVSTNCPEAYSLPVNDGERCEHWSPELPVGRIPSIWTGARIPDSYLDRFPRILKAWPHPGKKWPAGRMSDFENLPVPVRTVSDRVRRLVESFEPGVHQFMPVTFVRADNGEPLFEGEQRFFMNVCAWVSPKELFPIEAVQRALAAGFCASDQPRRNYLLEELRGRESGFVDGVKERFVSSFMFKQLVPNTRTTAIDEAAAKSRPLFVSTSIRIREPGPFQMYSGMDDELFVSEAFRDAVKRHKLTGARFEACTPIEQALRAVD